MRVRLITVVLAAVVAALASGPLAASAQAVPDGVGIGDDIFITGAEVIPPAGEAPRTMEEYEAAVYVQSWLACAFFCGPDVVREPPTDLPVYRIDTTGTWAGTPGTVTSYLVIDGTTPYVSFPGIEVWTDPVAAPPPSEWFTPPERVIGAFNGEEELIPTTGTENPASGATNDPEEEAAAPKDDDAGAPVPLFIAGGVAIVALIGGGLWWRRRRGGAEPLAD